MEGLGGGLICVCDDKETMEIRNLLKITKIYRGLPQFMANVAILLNSALTSEGHLFPSTPDTLPSKRNTTLGSGPPMTPV